LQSLSSQHDFNYAFDIFICPCPTPFWMNMKKQTLLSVSVFSGSLNFLRRTSADRGDGSGGPRRTPVDPGGSRRRTSAEHGGGGG
jgi:hypothetical protein